MKIKEGDHKHGHQGVLNSDCTTQILLECVKPGLTVKQREGRINERKQRWTKTEKMGGRKKESMEQKHWKIGTR